MRIQKFEHAWLYVNSDIKDKNRLLYTLFLHGRIKNVQVYVDLYYCIHKRKTTLIHVLVNITVDSYYIHICLACLAWRDIHVV